jgi:hypothetical protein
LDCFQEGQGKMKLTRYMPAEERLWARVDKGGVNGCWLWTGPVNSWGYARIRVNGLNVQAHRYSWEIHNGAIPDDRWVLHKCDVRNCVNPAHLFLGTRQANVDDMMAKGRHMPLVGEKNGQARLTSEDVKEIRRLHATGVAQRALARQFGVNRAMIYLIVRRKKWAHVK